MVTDEQICPFGIKSLDLLKREGFRSTTVRWGAAPRPCVHGREAPEDDARGSSRAMATTLPQASGRDVSKKDGVTYTNLSKERANEQARNHAHRWMLKAAHTRKS